MNKKFLLIGIIVAIVISVVSFQVFQTEEYQTEEKLFGETKVKLDIRSLFDIYAFEDNFEIENGAKIWHHAEFRLNPENEQTYQQLRSDSEAVVIFPIFTAAAYNEPGFYTYYRGECDEKCLTIELKDEYPPIFAASGNGVQILSLLGYNVISDVEVDQNPKILEEFDKVILLHNEYVTKKEFDAITSHPNVVYLYPNALYAQIDVDYQKNTITLQRGHSYPESDIANGFDWKFDNSNLEYNTDCIDMGFDRVENGWMLNCYPEYAIHQSKVLLKMIKDF